MTRILTALALAALSVSCVHAQTKGVLKTISNNALTEDLVIPAGKTITNNGTAVGFGGTWDSITGKPTTLAGYGITDPIVLTNGSYSNPAWITALAWSKISGTPTTLAGYGITDAQPLDPNLTQLTSLALEEWGTELLQLDGAESFKAYAGLGDLALLNAVGSAQITDGSIMNADINASAAIAVSKISGLGGLATLSAVGSSQITDGSIVDADISASAAIAVSKISGLQAALDAKWAKADTIVGSGTTLISGASYVVRGNATYTLNLPASPSDGDHIRLIQSGDTWTGTVTLARNGNQIDGASSDVTLGAPAGLYGGAMLLTYHSASGGWKIHRLGDVNSLGTIYATAGHTHVISAISSSNTNRLYGTGGTFATGQEITVSSALSLSAGTLTVASGGITNAMLAGSIDPTKITGTAAVLGANTFTGTQTLRAIQPSADDTYDIGVSFPGNRFRNGEFSGRVNATYLQIGPSASYIYPVTFNGVTGFRFTDAGGTNATALMIGPADASHPAITADGADLTVRLGDNSGAAKIKAKTLNLSNVPTSATGLSSGDIYSSAGVLMIVP